MGGIVSNSTKLKHSNYDILTLQYDLQGICGRSSSSTIFYSIRKETNTKVAIKQINIKQILTQCGNLNLLFNELEAIKQMKKHKFIVNIYSAFQLQSHCYLVQECLVGGDLRDHLRFGGMLSEKSVAYIISCIGSALHHMHLHGILHRDLKPENIVFDQYFHPKLVDFGISSFSSSRIPISTSTSGTLPYVAPEVLAVNHFHSTHADFWSLGLIGYELIYYQLPFKRHCPREFVHFVSNKYYKMWKKVLKYNTFYEEDCEDCCEDYEKEEEEPSYPIIDDNSFTEITIHPFVDINEPLPDNLKIYLPFTRIHDGKVISSECLSILEGLLTILIPRRLGSMSEYELFSNHSWFRSNGFDCSDILSEVESPLIYEHPYYWKVSHIHDEDLQEINDEINNDPMFTTEIKRKLMTYNYEHELENEEDIHSDGFETREHKLTQRCSAQITPPTITTPHQFS